MSDDKTKKRQQEQRIFAFVEREAGKRNANDSLCALAAELREVMPK